MLHNTVHSNLSHLVIRRVGHTSCELASCCRKLGHKVAQLTKEQNIPNGDEHMLGILPYTEVHIISCSAKGNIWLLPYILVTCGKAWRRYRVRRHDYCNHTHCMQNWATCGHTLRETMALKVAWSFRTSSDVVWFCTGSQSSPFDSAISSDSWSRHTTRWGRCSSRR